MVERYRRGKGKTQLLGNHQKCWVWGRHVVGETLRAGRWPILELFLSTQLAPRDLAAAKTLAERNAIPVFLESDPALHKRCRSEEHQGYVARMSPFPYEEPMTLLDRITRETTTPLIAICDSIQDPFNFGAMIRSADALGVDGIFIRATHQVGVTSLVARSSAGAVNNVPIACTDDLEHTVDALKGRGVRMIGTSHREGSPVYESDLRHPVAIIIGNEGVGLRDALLRRSDQLVRIPQYGRVASLNAAVSAGIMFYEAWRQRARGA